MKTTRTECFNTPVYQRRFKLNVFKKMDEDRQEAMEEQRNNVKGKGRISGQDLVAKLKNNEINPNQIG